MVKFEASESLWKTNTAGEGSPPLRSWFSQEFLECSSKSQVQKHRAVEGFTISGCQTVDSWWSPVGPECTGDLRNQTHEKRGRQVQRELSVEWVRLPGHEDGASLRDGAMLSHICFLMQQFLASSWHQCSRGWITLSSSLAPSLPCSNFALEFISSSSRALSLLALTSWARFLELWEPDLRSLLSLGPLWVSGWVGWSSSSADVTGCLLGFQNSSLSSNLNFVSCLNLLLDISLIL